MAALKGSRFVLYGILSVVTIASLAGATYFYLQYQQAQLALKNPTLAAQTEASQLIAKVGKLIDLPIGEQPTIATVSDISKLKDQPFFQNARNGDKVLIYTKAKKAILYDPLANKIVEVAPINLGNNANAPTTQQVRVVLYNGTALAGLTTSAEQTLKSQFTNLTVVSKEAAVKTDYTKTLVIDLSGTHADAAKQIAAALGGQVVSTLPDGERKPSNADILVIVAK